ncbi:hypothetical protein [Taklimakanibacter deserti]|uniref:hypothetical protein n=1 Tax=Taklimakanibacter deserti TaxID=2267839 RepID=UPI000E64E401
MVVKKRRRRDLQVRPPAPGAVRGLSPKVAEAIRLMAEQGMTRPEAAAAVGMKDDSLYRAFRAPIVRRHFHQLIDQVREAARPKAVQELARLSTEAASEKIRMESSKYIDGAHESRQPHGVTVNLGVGVQVQPGYIVDVSQHREKAREILRQAGSKCSALDVDYEERDRT